MPYSPRVPDWLSIIVRAALGVTSLSVLVYWSAGLWRMYRSWRQVPGAAAGVEAGRGSSRTVALIIPAHNEEVALARLIPTLRAQDHEHLRIVLCLDRCTDRSASVARELVGSDPRFQIMELALCRDGWAGKTSAVWAGVGSVLGQDRIRHLSALVDRDPEDASRVTMPEASPDLPDLLLFADADTEFHPSCVRSAVGLLESRQLDLASYLSTMNHEHWFELVVQPAAGVELMRQYPLDRINRRSGRRRAFANGQFMLFRREAYEAVGGHAAVKDELLEDIALARAIQEGWYGYRTPTGGQVGVFLAGAMLKCRMYDSWTQFQNGWRRIYIEGAKRRISRLRAGAWCSAWFGAIGPAVALATMPIVLLSGGPAIAEERILLGIAIAALIVHAAALVGIHRMGQTPLWATLCFAAGSLLTARILLDAARDLAQGRSVRWGGKEYIRTPR